MTTDADFWRMRDLLIQTVPITPIGFNWDMRRLDGKRFYDDNRPATGSWHAPFNSGKTKAANWSPTCCQKARMMPTSRCIPTIATWSQS